VRQVLEGGLASACGRLGIAGGHAQETEQGPQDLIALVHQILVAHLPGLQRPRLAPRPAARDLGGPMPGEGLDIGVQRAEIFRPLGGTDPPIVEPR
jgi:hypothetical protein